jgi:uncharacterized lipoprotein YmbA
MMTFDRRACALALTLLLAPILLPGCVNIGAGTPPREPTYVLEPTAPAASLERSGIPVGVGPVTIPAYLDRNEMIVREAQNRMRIDPLHFWGAPLKDEAQRVLGENLSRLLRTERISTWPWSKNAEITVRVSVQVLQFEPVAGRGVVLVARWQLLSPDAAKVLVARQSEIVEPVIAGPGPQAESMSRALGRLSSEIATEIRAMTATGFAESAR